MRPGEELREGWYLMSVADLELELARLRSPHEAFPSSHAKRLSTDEALAYRSAGNLPDETVLNYLNRASDAVYAMARYADDPDPELFEGRG